MIFEVSYRLVDHLELIEEFGMLLKKTVSVLWKGHQRAHTSKKRTLLSLGDSTHFL